MLRRGIWLFGFVVAALLGSVAARLSAQASTIDLISAGPSQAKPGQPSTFNFDWMLHPTIGINQDNASFTAHFRDGSLVQRADPRLTLADTLAIGRSAPPSLVTRIVQVHLLPLPSGGLLLLTALAPLVTVGWARRQRDGCSPSQ